VGDLFEGYTPANPFGIAAWDEMFELPGVLRPAASALHDALEALPPDWTALDPTAGSATGEHHVLVARGRDYGDVPPIKGIFHGGPISQLDVKVSLTRLA
jgi:transglutaminase-like putative cysteine protease